MKVINKSKLKKIEEINILLKNKLEKAINSETAHVDNHKIAKITLQYSPIDLAYTIIHFPKYFNPLR